MVRDKKWARNPIDAFVLSRLEKEGLKPSPEADKTTLIRRVTLDLTGLPPTPEEVDAFLRDKSKDAYEKVVDRLLASPHYGEKMALPWLDAARYADSNGFQQDGDNFQFVWRDWVVKAMNEDMPFDRFATLQLAGDLVPGATPDTEEGRDMLVATAFNRNHMLNGEGGAIAEEQRNVNLFDRVETTSTVFLGLTMTCARCHDHKYDPLTQRDYYSLMAFFNNVPETGMPEGGNPFSIAAPWINAGTPEQMAELGRLQEALKLARAASSKFKKSDEVTRLFGEWSSVDHPDAPDKIRNLLALKDRKPSESSELLTYYLESVYSGSGKAVLEDEKKAENALTEFGRVLPRVMVMSDTQPRKTYIYSRGTYTDHLEEVTADTPAALPPMTKAEPKNRLGLAEWIVDPANPLTSRVQVNRAWQTFFGKGLVSTPENFGVQSEPPTYPELLDWLATEYVRSGWDTKALHRLIVTSATYRQSSKVGKELYARDPDNSLLARGARFRMPAMVLRDVALAASGLIDLKIGGKPVYPYQPTGIWDSLAITEERDFTYPQSHGSDLYRRSLYSFWRRTVAPGNMFDAASRQVCTVREYRTSTPLHALTTMNDVTWVEAGRALAQRVMNATAKTDDRLTLAFRLVCARRPDKEELAILRESLRKATVHYKGDPASAEEFLKQGESPRDESLDTIEHAAMANVCLAILNLDEALTRE
jgi:hypothetical protein